jgi:hypothetical protein
MFDTFTRWNSFKSAGKNPDAENHARHGAQACRECRRLPQDGARGCANRARDSELKGYRVRGTTIHFPLPTSHLTSPSPRTRYEARQRTYSGERENARKSEAESRVLFFSFCRAGICSPPGRVFAAHNRRFGATA